jgi:hypothetical protein
MQVAGVRVIEIHYLIKFTWRQGIMQCVLYVPNFNIIFLSIGQMLEKHIISLYGKDIYKMFSSKDLDILLMIGIKDDHVWKMKI